MSVMDRIRGRQEPRGGHGTFRDIEDAERQRLQRRKEEVRAQLRPQSADQIKGKVTAMRENTDREITRHRDELNRLENLVREGEMLACAVVDRYEEATNRVRNAMADLLSTGICELSAHLQAVNTAARRQLDEPKVAADAEASNPQPDMGIPGTATRHREAISRAMARVQPGAVIGEWVKDERGEGMFGTPRARLGEAAQSVSGLGDIGDPTEAKTHHGPRQGD
jgi:hypothetical protein